MHLEIFLNNFKDLSFNKPKYVKMRQRKGSGAGPVVSVPNPLEPGFGW